MHDRSSSVTLDVQSGFATITLVQTESVISKDVLLSLSNAVRECACRARDISAVFLWIAAPSHLDRALQEGIFATNWQKDVDSLCETVNRLPQCVVGFAAAAGPISTAATSLLVNCDVVFATSDAKFLLSHIGSAPAAVDCMTACKFGLVAEVFQDVSALRARHADLHEASLFTAPADGGSVKELMRSAMRGTKMNERHRAEADAWNDEPAYIQTTLPAPQACALFTDSLQPPEYPTLLAWGAPPGAELPLPKFGVPSKPHAEGHKKDLRLLEPMHIVLDVALENNSLVGNAVGGAKDGATHEKVEANCSKAAGPQRPPKNKNHGDMFKSYRGPITSIMICNIPCRIAQVELADIVDNLGFKEKYDYLYLPTGGRSSKAGISNLGYGFINFPEPDDTEDFYRAFTGYKFNGTPSLKETSLRPAHVQGCNTPEKEQKDQGSYKPPVKQAARRARRSKRAKTKDEETELESENFGHEVPQKYPLLLFNECSI